MRTSVTDRNGALQGRGDRLNGGYVRFYTETPANADSAPVGTLVAQCLLSNPACAAPSNGTMAFNTIGGTTVLASGTPTVARFIRSDGTTVVADMDIPGDLTLLKSTWTLGEPFAGPSVTWSQAAE